MESVRSMARSQESYVTLSKSSRWKWSSTLSKISSLCRVMGQQSQFQRSRYLGFGNILYGNLKYYKKEAIKQKFAGRQVQSPPQNPPLLICYYFLQYCISFVMSLDCVIYLALTLAIPFKLTYSALKEDNKQHQLALWSHYWGFFIILSLLQCWLSFLSYQPFKLVILLLHVWLYAEDYQGALFLSNLIKTKIRQMGLEQHINTLYYDNKIRSQALSVAKIFEAGEGESKPVEEVKKD